MVDDKTFTEYNDEELEKWFREHIKGWSGRAVSSKENYEIVIAEMQRRYIKAQNEANKKIIGLTDKLVALTNRMNFLTFILIVLTLVQLILLIRR